MKNVDIYAIGAALVDTEIEVDDADIAKFGIEKGVMTLVDQARQSELLELLKGHLVHSKMSSGGSAANTVIAANFFGTHNFYCCKVANDELGAFYLNDLSQAGVLYNKNNGSEAGITGKCLVLITPDAERTMNTYLGISETISIANIDEDALRSANFAYIEGYLVTSETGKPAAIKVRELAEQHGVKTALSLSDPAMVEFFRDGLIDMLGEGVDLLFCNEQEAIKFTQRANIEEACEALKPYARSFAITLGAKGALVFDGEHYHRIEGVEAKAIDTNGAGDMFAGAFLAALSQGKDFPTAARFGNLTASKVVSQYGPRLEAEQHAELLKKL